jgi:hypothetical protein
VIQQIHVQQITLKPYSSDSAAKQQIQHIYSDPLASRPHSRNSARYSTDTAQIQRDTADTVYGFIAQGLCCPTDVALHQEQFATCALIECPGVLRPACFRTPLPLVGSFVWETGRPPRQPQRRAESVKAEPTRHNITPVSTRVDNTSSSRRVHANTVVNRIPQSMSKLTRGRSTLAARCMRPASRSGRTSRRSGA